MITPSFSLTATERVLPKLALDFTTASLDARVTFARSGNTATVVNSSGVIAAINADLPRFDHDPVSLACQGLLIEESRTNIVLQSAFASGWTFNAAGSFGVTTRTAPDNSTAQVLTDSSTTLSGQVFQSIALVSGTVYTFSVYVKAVARSIGLIQSFTQVGSFTFDLTGSGSVGTPSGVFTNPTIKAVGNDWFRITGVLTATATGNNNLGLSTNSNIYTGNAWAVWAAQLEVGAFATSYIPTTTTALTRNADVATMTGTNFSDWYSAGVGGVVARVLPSTVLGTRPALQFDDATANEVITLRGDTTNPELVIVDGGSPQAQIDAGTIAANTAYNLGAAWDTNNCAAAVNGGAAVTDNTATIPTVTQARLGSDSTNYLNGHLQTLRYWPQRIINAEVQAFSK
jgi:hypothetical protein